MSVRERRTQWALVWMLLWGACQTPGRAGQVENHPNTLLVKAVEANDVKAAQGALEKGAAPDATIDGNPVSCMAAFHGQAAMLRTLLDHGARSDTRAFADHMTLLMFATLSGNTETVQLLLDRKVKIDLQNDLGETALMLVREAPPAPVMELPRALTPIKTSERPAILKLLLQAGADKEKRDIEGRTALMRYAKYGILEGVEVLADAGAKVNTRDKEGNTALILAAGWRFIDKSLPTDGYLPIVQRLLRQGADIRVKNRAGVTALLAARRAGHDDIITALLSPRVIEKPKTAPPKEP